jgi:hypothetical protein
LAKKYDVRMFEAIVIAAAVIEVAIVWLLTR